MLKILGRNNSSNVQKVIWACEEMGLAYEREEIGGPFGGNKEPEYLAMNPNGVVPTIVDDGFVLWESNVIVRYLSDKHRPNVLLPENPSERAIAEQWMDWQQTAVGPAMVPVFWGLVRTPAAERDQEAISAGRDRYEFFMTMLDSRLSESAYIAGEQFSMGDIPIGIMAYRWFTLDIERAELPHLARWYDNLSQRAAFRNHIMIGLT